MGQKSKPFKKTGRTSEAFNEKASKYEGSLVNKRVIIDEKYFDDFYKGLGFEPDSSLIVTSDNIRSDSRRIRVHNDPSERESLKKTTYNATHFLMK